MNPTPFQTPLRGMILAAMFGAATAAGAYVMIPFPLVPVTLQTFFLYTAALLLGARLGALSQAVYLLLGIIGLPVFAGGKAGIGVLFGPTGGYLFGFVAAALVTGWIAAPRPGPAGLARMLAAMAAGTACLYALGVTQLALVAHLAPSRALAVGVLPFVPGDALKIAVAALISRKLQPRLMPARAGAADSGQPGGLA